ncbi:MAG TPA: HEAT repeat domain-containing protein [Thermoanaerobaculia bacterium]|nr:HEAT repeat domain-containing protein [Thermoanaerobaculia bacterium]
MRKPIRKTTALCSLLGLALATAAGAQVPGPPKVEDARVETVPASGDLSTVVRQAGRGGQPVWVAWAVPVIEGQGYTCCWSRDWKPGACKLEAKNQSWGSSDDKDRRLPPPDPYLAVLARVEDGKVGKVRSFSLNCPLDAGGRRFVWLEGVKPEESVHWLRELARGDKSQNPEETTEEALDSLALHRNASATEALAHFAAGPYPRELRGHSLFWLGQARGRAGYEAVARVLREDKDDELREKALFALSESPVPEAGETLLQTARTDHSSEIRSEALFWLAQMDHPKAPAAILEAVAKDPDPEVREQAVFALSELPDGKGIPLLIKLGRESKDREVRKQAVFWLSESDHPEAMSFLERLLED